MKPLIAVCITIYNESREQLEGTIDGVLANMKIFNERANISSSEVVVVVIFDGIDKMNQSSEEKHSMIEYFRDLDRTFAISEMPRFEAQEGQNEQ